MVRPLVSKLMVVTMRQACFGGTFNGGAEFFLGRHGFNPEDVNAALLQGHGLLFKSGNAFLMGHGSYGHEDFARGAHGTADINGATCGFCFGAGVGGGGHIDFAHPALLVVELEAMAVSTKGVGENDIGTRCNEFPVKLAHPFRMLEIPHLRRIAGHQAHLKVIGAGRTVCQEPGTGIERFGEGWAGHGNLRKWI